MAHAPIAADFLQTLDILLDHVMKLPLDAVFFLDHFAQTIGILSRQILGARIHIHRKFLQDLLARRQADAVNIRQSDLDSFVIWNVDSRYSDHTIFTYDLRPTTYDIHISPVFHFQSVVSRLSLVVC